jgi:hypothetical protein
MPKVFSMTASPSTPFVPFETHNLPHSALPLAADALDFTSAVSENGSDFYLTDVEKHCRPGENASPRFEFPEGASGFISSPILQDDYPVRKPSGCTAA